MWYIPDLARVLERARRAEMRSTNRRQAKPIVAAERRRVRLAPAR